MSARHGLSSEGGTRGKYDEQVRLLERTFEQIRKFDVAPLAAVLQAARRRQTIYVGSGGALAVARLAVDLHESQTKTLARAATPLELLGLPPLYDSAVIVYTAGGRHPDAAVSIEAARRMQAHPIVVVTHRRRDELGGDLVGPDVEVVTLPTVAAKEGFLATNSVLAMAAAMVLATGAKLPARLPHLESNGARPVREQTLILSGPGLNAVATDLETRLAETGLSSAQVTDYRNFAHGRHTGLSRRLMQTSVVALVTPEFAQLAEATLAKLPDQTDVIRLESRLPWPGCVLDLLVASMKLIAATSVGTGLDPSRPTVPEFGRRLYHLSSRRYVRGWPHPVHRKLAAARLHEEVRVRKRYEQALNGWLADLHALRIGGVVLDYDGTVCATAARFELPAPHTREQLLRVLEAGATIGIASGRGRSLHRDLRAWVPKRFWQSIELGLYSGGVHLRLDEDVEEAAAASPVIRDAAARIRAIPVGSLLRLEEREHQLSIQLGPSSGLDGESLARLVVEALARTPELALKVGASAHSVDVVPADSGKTLTLDRVRGRVDGEVVAIGDQGQVGGNDFELLAATRWSLSVDRVSGDPSRCWNLDRRGEVGPVLLGRYLASLRTVRGALAFRWKP